MQSAQKSKARFFPETSDKSVAYWLLGSAASVFGIVVFGGLTRLTESGYVLCAKSFRTVLTVAKSEYYGMETGNRLFTTT